ncbi:MAG: hypothetical protein EBR38_05930 [Flavobacteriaceae bacterium]|nr:hypothetical protein [Flavobacteriaceae bacterium]
MKKNNFFKKEIQISILLIFSIYPMFCQVGIGTTTPTDLSALDIRTTDKGLLIPRLTTNQRNALTASLTTANNVNNLGMQVYDTETNSIWYWNNSAWKKVADTSLITAATSYKPILDNTIANSLNVSAVGRYIVPATGLTNGFVGQANKYTDYDGSTFVYTTPTSGDKVTIEGGTNTGIVYTYTGGVWLQKNTVNTIKMYAGSYTVPSANDATTKNLCTLAQTGGWVVDLVGEGFNWSQRFKISNTTTFSLSGTNTINGPIGGDISGGSTQSANRNDILYSKDITVSPLIGYATLSTSITQGKIEAWTNDGSSKISITWWGHEFNTRLMRWNITIINL